MRNRLRAFGLDTGKKTLFVVGGSLGARSVNEAIAAGLEKLSENGIQLIWQTGTGFADKASALAKDREGVWTSAFINEIEKAYAVADVVVSRSGAMSVTELCMVARPVVFVPYPHAAEDHQRANAMALVNKNAALLVDDRDVMVKLVDTVIGLFAAPEIMQKFRENIVKMQYPDADKVIAKAILESINK